MGFRLRRLPAKQQPQGPRDSPAPLCRTATGGAGCEIGLRSFPEFWPVGAGVCSPMSVSCPFADCSPQELGWCRWGTEPRCCLAQLGSGGIAGAWAQKVFARPILYPVKEDTLGVGFRLRRSPAKPQGPGGQRQPSPALPDMERQAGCQNGLRWYPEQRRGGACVCCPRSVSCLFAESSAQELGGCRWGDSASRFSGQVCLRCITGAWA